MNSTSVSVCVCKRVCEGGECMNVRPVVSQHLRQLEEQTRVFVGSGLTFALSLGGLLTQDSSQQCKASHLERVWDPTSPIGLSASLSAV